MANAPIIWKGSDAQLLCSGNLLDSSGNVIGGAAFSFATIQPPAGTSPVADAASDTLTLTSSDSSITITGTAGTDTLDFVLGTVLIADNAFTLKDNGDASKRAVFECSGISASTTRTFTFPNLSSTLACTGGSQTFSSKSLTESNFLVDSSDATKKGAWSLSGATTGTTTTLTFVQSASRAITFPDYDCTLNTIVPTRKFEFFDDCQGYTSAGNGGALTFGNQSGTAFGISDATMSVPDGTTLGVIKTTLNSSTDYCCPSYQSAAAAFMTAAGGELITEWRVCILNLSDGTNTYAFRAGAGDSINGTAPTNGIFLYYTHSNNSGKWSGVTINNSSATQVDSNITVAVNTWYTLRTVTNSAGTQTDFYVSTSGGAFTNIGSSTTNIPNVYPRFFAAPWGQFSQSAGTGNVAVLWDYAYCRKMVTR
jgi:hypothetical protein